MKWFVVSLSILLLLGAGFLTYVAIFYPIKHKDEIMIASRQFDIPPELISAVILSESRFRDNQTSHRGAQGLMQLMPSTARFIGEKVGIADADESLMIPSFNIMLGTAYLRYLLDKFVDTRTALAAYNAGEGRVTTWLTMDDFSKEQNGRRVITSTPYPATNAYLAKVTRAKRWYSWRF